MRTHAEIEARARRAATGLAALGVRPGDGVALLLHNDIASIEAQRAAALLGAVAVPLDRHMDEDDLLFVLRDCDARVLVAHGDLLAPLRVSLPIGLRVVAVPTPAYVKALSNSRSDDKPEPPSPLAGEGARRADEGSGNLAVSPRPGLLISNTERPLIRRFAPAPPIGAEGGPAKIEQTGGDEPWWDTWLAGHPLFADKPAEAAPSLSYTSGSTGRPKGVRRIGSRPGGCDKALRVYGFDQPGRAVALVTGPLSHSVPRAFTRLALGTGADIVLMPRFEAAEALALIARHRVTHVHLSPAMMLRMLRLRGRPDTGSLRHVVHGAAHCPPALKAEAIAAWGPIVHEYYGSTETGLLTLADSADATSHPGSVGRALPGIALAVLDADGRPLPAGVAGTIYARSASLHRFTYLGRDAERAAIGRGDVVTAGDVGHLDADGYLYLHDRGRDLIRVGDETVVPAEIEAAILGLPGVADCAVLGLHGPNGCDIVCACVEPLPGAHLRPEAIREALGASARRLDRIEIVADLPRADTGKIFKHELRARLVAS